MTFTVDDRYVVISSDTHAGADKLDYRPYLSAGWHDEFDAWISSLQDSSSGNSFVKLTQFDADRSWNSDRRITDLESEGIVGEVIFPNTTPPFFSMSPPTASDAEKRWAGLQAHNRWLADFCSLAPKSRAGVAQIMLHDVDAAVREVRWVHDHRLFGGILLPLVPLNDPLVAPLYAPEYEPLWATCEELGVVVHSHAGFLSSSWGVGKYPAAGAIYIEEISEYTHRVLGHLILSGVFARHPNLRFAMAEQGSGWIIDERRRLDRVYEAMHGNPRTAIAAYGAAVRTELTMTPSEYTLRNCRLGSSFLRPAEAARRHEIGLSMIMWGSDYPHTEGTFPFTVEALRWSFAGIPSDEVAGMLGGNAAALYGFDVEVLQSRAAEVGPRVDDVAQPLTEPPEESLSGAFTNVTDFSEEGCEMPSRK